jgi:hypothetical protein
MNRIRRYTGRLFALLLILCITFLLFAVAVPSVTGANPIRLTGGGTSRSRVTDVRTTAQKDGRAYFLTAFSGNEIISAIEVNLLTDRSNRDFRGLLFRFNKLLLPIISLGVLVLCFGHVIDKKDRHKSILAVSLGGHAPPQSLQADDTF